MPETNDWRRLYQGREAARGGEKKANVLAGLIEETERKLGEVPDTVSADKERSLLTQRLEVLQRAQNLPEGERLEYLADALVEGHLLVPEFEQLKAEAGTAAPASEPGAPELVPSPEPVAPPAPAL